MARALLDESVPFGLRRLLGEHIVAHVTRLGWDGVSNGELVARAEREGFDVLVTSDQNLVYQRNLAGRRIGLVVLSSNNWDLIRAKSDRIAASLDICVRDGSVQSVDLGRPGQRLGRSETGDR